MSEQVPSSMTDADYRIRAEALEYANSKQAETAHYDFHDAYDAKLIALIRDDERERIRLAFWSAFKGSGENFFDYLHGEDAAQASVAQHWQYVLDELKEKP